MFKVGQPVWCVMFGKGVVMEILTSEGRYPLAVEFPDTCVEHYTLDGKYAVCAAQTLFPHPIEIVKKIVKPSINWDNVRDEYIFLAQDDMGNAWLYKEEPTIDDDDGYWDAALGNFALADTHASYTPGTCDWKDSLVARPKDA